MYSFDMHLEINGEFIMLQLRQPAYMYFCITVKILLLCNVNRY